MNEILVTPTTSDHIASFRQGLDQVARERRHLAFVEAPSLDEVTAFVNWVSSGAGVQYVALAPDSQVVGWCDIVRNPREGFRHCGLLGMGVLSEFRRRGIGRRLLHATVEKALELGVTRVELEVFASNRGAIALYDSTGFVREGIKRGARQLDGVVDDIVLMALSLDQSSLQENT